MDDFKSLQKLSEEMNRYYKSIQPVSLQFEKAFTIPESTLLQIKNISNTLENILPSYAYNFQIASTYFETFTTIKFHLPDYIIGFQKLNNSLIHATEKLSRVYNIVQGIMAENNLAPEVMPNYIVKPAIEIAGHYKTLKDLDILENEDAKILEDDYIEITDDYSKKTDEIIYKVEPDWLILLQGAEQSLVSANPDKIRHTIISLRELVTQIIHKMAPDNEIKKKYKEPYWYSEKDKRPTRRTRLHYILTNIYGNDVLLDFIDKDIDAILSLFDLYQHGTHQIVNNMNNEQLRFILIRTEVLVGQLLSKGEIEN